MLNQDENLKKLREIEDLEKTGIVPEAKFVNLSLLIYTTIFSFIVISIIFFHGPVEGITFRIAILFITLALLSETGAYHNKSWGKLLLILTALILDLYITYYEPKHYSDLIDLVDISVIFVCANNFKKPGYFFGSLIVIIKILTTYFLFKSDHGIVNLLASIIATMALGSIPIIVMLFGSLTRKAKKQTIKAEILSLQNQELLHEWQNYFSKDQISPKSKSPQSGNNIKDISKPYTSPYLKDNEI